MDNNENLNEALNGAMSEAAPDSEEMYKSVASNEESAEFSTEFTESQLDETEKMTEFDEFNEADSEKEETKDKKSKKKGKKAEKTQKTDIKGIANEKLEKLKDVEVGAHTKHLIFLSVVAVLILVAILSAQFIFNNYLQTASENEIVTWMFVTGQSDEHVAKAEKYNQAEASNRIYKPITDNYVHCRYNIPASAESQVLTFVTEYSPAKVLIDKDEIYNNGYGTTELVGNSYNEVIIPASTNDRVLHLYLYYPLGFNLKATLSPISDASAFSAMNVVSNLGLIFAAAVVLLGILMIVTTFGIMFRSRDIVTLNIFSAIVILSGVAIFLKQLSYHSSTFSSFFMFSATNSIICIVMFAAIASVHSYMANKKSITLVLAALIPAFSAIAWIPMGALTVKISIILSTAALIASGVFLFLEIKDIENIFVSHHSLIHISGCFVILCFAYNGISLIFNAGQFSQFVFSIAMIIFSIMLYYVHIDKIASKSMKEYIVEKKEDDFGEYSDAISNIAAKAYQCKTRSEFVDCFCKETTKFLRESNLIINGANVSCRAAILKKSGYDEVFNDNCKGECEYGVIADSFTELESSITVGSSYVNMMLGGSTEHRAITVIMFDNAYNHPEAGLQNFFSLLFNAVNIFYNVIFEKKSMQDSVVNVFMNLADIVEAKSKGTGDHLIDVANMTRIVCEGLGYDEAKANTVATAAILHDIGKIIVPSYILNKEGPLTPEERSIMQQHIITGYNMLSNVEGEVFEIASQITLEHHENYNGTGYLGKSGNDISIYARIVKIVDVFDALVSERQYKRKWTYEEALNYLAENMGSEFDPDILHVFMSKGMEIINIKESVRADKLSFVKGAETV